MRERVWSNVPDEPEPDLGRWYPDCAFDDVGEDDDDEEDD